MPQLCARRASVIWTRHRRRPDLTPRIRAWFHEAGFVERTFESPAPDPGRWVSNSVGSRDSYERMRLCSRSFADGIRFEAAC